MLSYLEAMLSYLGAIFGPSSRQLAAMLSYLGTTCAIVGPSCEGLPGASARLNRRRPFLAPLSRFSSIFQDFREQRLELS